MASQYPAEIWPPAAQGNSLFPSVACKDTIMSSRILCDLRLVICVGNSNWTATANVGNLAIEFWPEIHRKVFGQKQGAQNSQSPP
jgi:hypothetical protein